ncbi:MAG TPA: hypothetical protein VKA37_06690 [Halobacteriales archaeon]|nr:hypothetical protein [Halobacteriales archaeon]
MAPPPDEPPPDGEPGGSGVVAYLRRGVRWLRELHRGYAYTGHLPRHWD